jgi:hypothetical protein
MTNGWLFQHSLCIYANTLASHASINQFELTATPLGGDSLNRWLKIQSLSA